MKPIAAKQAKPSPTKKQEKKLSAISHQTPNKAAVKTPKKETEKVVGQKRQASALPPNKKETRGKRAKKWRDAIKLCQLINFRYYLQY